MFYKELAECLYNEFGDVYKACFSYKCANDIIPMLYDANTHVKLVDNQNKPIAYCNIVRDDVGMLFSHKYSGPWLANVWVAKDYRGQGYGRKIIKQLLMGWPKNRALYLWCNDARLVGYYQQFGFVTLETIALERGLVYIMCLKVSKCRIV